jgi:hypothetical protein
MKSPILEICMRQAVAHPEDLRRFAAELQQVNS